MKKMRKNRGLQFQLVVLMLAICLPFCLTACGSAKKLYPGKYTLGSSISGHTFSGYEFFDDGSVTLYCAGYKNSYGTYQAKGNHYEVTIDTVGQDSYYASMVQEIKEKGNIIVTPVDEDTIEVEIKARDINETYLDMGKVKYTRNK